MFCFAKFTEFGFILLPWQFTEAQTLKLLELIVHTHGAKRQCEVTCGIFKGFAAQ